jgi:hypothetical protein
MRKSNLKKRRRIESEGSYFKHTDTYRIVRLKIIHLITMCRCKFLIPSDSLAILVDSLTMTTT